MCAGGNIRAEHTWYGGYHPDMYSRISFSQPGLFGSGVNIWDFGPELDHWESVGITVQGYPPGARFAIVHLASRMTDHAYSGNLGPKLAAPELSFAALRSHAVPYLSIPSKAAGAGER